MSTFLVDATASAGEAPPPVQVRAPECDVPSIDRDELIDVLRVELAPGASGDRDAPTDGARSATSTLIVDVEAPCRTSPDRVVIRVLADGHVRTTRLVELDDLPASARLRAIALVTAELLRPHAGARPEDAGEHDAVPRPGETPSFEASSRSRKGSPSLPPAAHPDWEVAAAMQGRAFVRAPTLLVGGELGLRLARARVGVDLLRGGVDDRLGDLTVTLLGASLGLDLWHLARGSFGVSLAPRLGGGFLVAEARAAGDATSRGTRAPYFDAALQLGAHVRIAPRWCLTAGVEVGYARGVIATADERVLARPDGLLTGLRVGMAFAPEPGRGDARRTTSSHRPIPEAQ